MIQFQCTHCDNIFNIVSYNVVLHLKPCGTIDLLIFDKIPCCSNNKKLYGGLDLISKH